MSGTFDQSSRTENSDGEHVDETVREASWDATPLTASERTRATARALAFGAAGAALGAATYTSVVILTGYETGLFAWLLGLLTMCPTALAGARLHVATLRAIGVALTLLGVLVSEYVIVRHLAGVADSSVSAAITAVHDDLAADPMTLLFWGIALLIAWQTAALTVTVTPPAQLPPGASPTLTRFAHAMQWSAGRGANLIAAAAFLTGSAVLVGLGTTGAATVTTTSVAATHDPLGSKIIPAPAGFQFDPSLPAGPVTRTEFDQLFGPATAAYRSGYQVTYFGIQNNDFVIVYLARYSTPAGAADLVSTNVDDPDMSGYDPAIPGAIDTDTHTADKGAYYHTEFASRGATVMIVVYANSHKARPALLRHLARQQYDLLRTPR